MTEAQERNGHRLRVNGIAVLLIRLRYRPDVPDDFEIVIHEPQKGLSFALHSGFDIEIHERGLGWRQVTLDELKHVLVEENQRVGAVTFPKAAETKRELIGCVAEGEHIMRAEAALFRSGIPFLLLPFQANKFASNLFMVTSLSRAKSCLARAGFREKVGSETVLIDGRTGKPIQLIEGNCKLEGANS